MKKLCSFFAAALTAVSGAFASDIAFRIMPAYNITSESNYDKTAGGSVGFEYAPLTLRQRDSVYFTLNAGLVQIAADGIDNTNCFTGTVGAGYNWRFSDRFSLSLEAFGGAYTISENEASDLDGESGLVAGGRGMFSFHMTPALSLGLFGGYTKFFYNSSPAIGANTEIGLSLRYSLSKGLFGRASMAATDSSMQPVFPVFYSHYEDHPFGTMTFVNSESNDISNVEVYVYIEQFMASPTLAFKLDKVKRGESFTADLTAFLNENILNNIGASETSAVVTVSYNSLWKNVKYEEPVVLTTLGRNNMNWSDDRQAAAFVSGHDAAAYLFANRVKAIVKDSLVSSVPENIQYAAAMFGALKRYGINYVVDPSSAFTANAGTAEVDFLQFPYQTLRYHGGDCDDLTILNCSLLEAIGIETAFITIPGHIYMAFDSGLKPADAAKAGDCIVQNDKVWIPVEITLTQDTFKMERQVGLRQWNKNKADGALIPVHEAWSEFKAVAIPESDIKMELPSKDVILSEFKKQL